MAEIGQARGGLIAGAFVLAAALGCAALWGFTVDDALISVQYARNVVGGVGYRFDPGGGPSDGVTPLPWPLLLAPLAKGPALDVLFRARLVGVLAYLGAAFALGRFAVRARAPGWAKLAAVAVLLVCVPAAAHAVSGMETAVVLLLATLAATAESAWLAALFAGLAAAFRPEMVPWALAFAALRAPGSVAMRLRAGALALAPPLVVVLVRLAVFGHAAPLAIHAKPADLGQGIAYAIAAALSSATPWLGVSWVALRSGGRARALALAFGVHLASVAAAGGDWMPLARLVAPLAPGLLVSWIESAADVPRWSRVLRALLVVGFGWIPLVVAFRSARGVHEDRRALIEAARPELAECKYIAALDVGWVSASANDGTRLLDLGGLTDPEIAYLPGSHTSKRIDAGMLLDRGVDCALLYVEGPAGDPEGWREAPFAHVVDQRLARSELFAAHFGGPTIFALGPRDKSGEIVRGYVLVRRLEHP